MKKIARFFSRITVRLLCFNILIVFLPVAGFLYLDTYEKQLVKSLEDSMAQQGRLVSASLSENPFSPQFSQEQLRVESDRILSNLANRTESRLRIVNSAGILLSDSSAGSLQTEQDQEDETYASRSWERESGSSQDKNARDNPLYMIGSELMHLYKKIFLPPVPGREPQVYSKLEPFTGREIMSALAGRYGATTRISAGGQRSMTLYAALPIWNGEKVAGAVLVSQSTYKILKDLYEIRLAIFRVFVASVCAAILISIFLSFTIGRPLRKLMIEAGAIVDHRGRMTRRFAPLARYDEVGDLSRSLVKLTTQLENHIAFIESFAGDISHEFKNPLASIRSSAELALEARDSGDKERFLAKILGDCIRMEKLISGVREISRIDARLAEEDTEAVDILVLLANLVSGYGQKSGRLKFSFVSRDERIRIKASHYRLTEIFENLIDNAVSFSGDGEKITIDAGSAHGRATITIRDCGPGIPAGHLTKIFERFFSYRPSENGRKEHTGLGLAIVKAIVEGYGGSIAASNAEGGGAIFTVTLPCMD